MPIAHAAEDVESLLEMELAHLQGGPSRWRLPTRWCTACDVERQYCL